jgi:long-subunit acyl-CoA synthetase (AMP-forming)
VGYPVPDVRILILDENGNDAGLERVGEIAAESEYLALGYWKNPTVTDQQFFSRNGKRIYKTGDIGRLRADGCLEYLGRKDDLRVKVRGQFVAPAEIEAQLKAVKEVKDAAVVARPNRWGENELVAFVVTSESISALRSQLEGGVSDGIPKLIRLDALPLNENGKVDRRALQTMKIEMEQPDWVAPRTETESRLTNIWTDVLGMENLSVEARFFEIGGDSLRAFQILSRLRDEFGIDLNPIEFFDAPTIAAQAELLDSALRRKIEVRS